MVRRGAGACGGAWSVAVFIVGSTIAFAGMIG